MSAPLQTSYDSIASAAAALGTTKKRLQWAKDNGAPGFRGSRVYPAELTPWLKEQEAEIVEAEANDKEPLELRKLRLQCESLEHDIRRKAGSAWESNDVRASWLLHMRQARQVLQQAKTDYAPRIAGHGAIECGQLLGQMVEEALAKLRNNPYGDAGECVCPKCGENFTGALIERPGVKGNEEKRETTMDAAPHLGADVLAKAGADDTGGAVSGAPKRSAKAKRHRKSKARPGPRKVK